MYICNQPASKIIVPCCAQIQAETTFALPATWYIAFDLHFDEVTAQTFSAYYNTQKVWFRAAARQTISLCCAWRVDLCSMAWSDVCLLQLQVKDQGSGYHYNAVHRWYYDAASSMYYGGEPPTWTKVPDVPADATYEAMTVSAAEGSTACSALLGSCSALHHCDEIWQQPCSRRIFRWTHMLVSLESMLTPPVKRMLLPQAVLRILLLLHLCF